MDDFKIVPTFNWVVMLVTTAILLHVVFLKAYGTERVRRGVDRFMDYGANLWSVLFAVLLIALATIYSTPPLFRLLDGMNDRDTTFWLEVAVQVFGFFALLAAVIPVLLSEHRTSANWLSLLALAFLAMGSAAGNVFKFMATTSDPRTNLAVTLAFVFVSCAWGVVATTLYSFYLRHFAARWQASRLNPLRVSGDRGESRQGAGPQGP